MFYVKVYAHIQKVSTEFLPKRTAILKDHWLLMYAEPLLRQIRTR
jgi:hypothetical protein